MKNKIRNYLIHLRNKISWFIFGKDYSLYSGERQTAGEIEKIRYDHLARYYYVADFIKQHFSKKKIKILDCFCGNGYGSNIIATKMPDSDIYAIDGSQEAIDFAKKNYGRDNLIFHCNLFPFSFPEETYDCIVSLESLEHVKEDKNFLRGIMRSLKKGGFLFLSVPNEKIMNLRKNQNRFRFHFKHYNITEIENLICSNGGQIRTIKSQNTYVIDCSGYVVDMLPETEMGLTNSTEQQTLLFVIQK